MADTHEKTEKELRDEESKKAGEKYLADLEKRSDINKEEKEILKLYNEGVQNFEIAKRVYKFVNADTVGQVVLTIRKQHADDFNELEDVNSTRGYSGVSGT